MARGLVFPAAENAEPGDIRGNVFKPVRFVYEHGKTQFHQPFHLLELIPFFPGDDQVGLQGQDRFYIEIVIPAHRRDPARLLRVIAVVDRAYDPVADARGKQVLGNVGGQADDARGRPLQRHCPADIVNHGDRLGAWRDSRGQGKKPEY